MIRTQNGFLFLPYVFAYGGSFIALGAWEPLCNWFKSMDYSNASSWQYAMVCIATLCFWVFCFALA